MPSLKNTPFVRGIVFIFAFLGFLVFEIPDSAAQEIDLFAEVPIKEGFSFISSHTTDDSIIRTRYVRPNFKVLIASQSSTAPVIIRLNLFDDADYRGILDQIRENKSGSTSWVGHLEGIPLSNFTLITRGSMMMGTVKMPGAFYRIGYLGDGIHAIHEMDEGVFPPELEPISAQSTANLDVHNSLTADDGSEIDVLVVYTQQASANIGDEGFADISDLIDLALVETNTSYGNSDIAQRLNLVHTTLTTYDETGLDWKETLTRLSGALDGYMDDIHTTRDNTCADAAVLLVDNQDSCGIGYINSDAGTAFSVISTHCATGYYSFGHELGHNMGAYHDWYVDDTNSFAHGYVNYPDRWRTIMAYNSDCFDRGVNCTRLQYWSNPLISYGGDPMGVPDGTSRACVLGAHDPTCDADNHVMLIGTAVTVANFRDSGLCEVGPLVYAGHTVNDNNINESRGDDDGVAECGEIIELFVDLTNQGIATATGITTTLSTVDPYINFLFNTDSGYPDIPGSGTDDNDNDYDFAIAPDTPNGHTISFGLDITAGNGGPWTDSFDLIVGCSNVYIPFVER